MSPLIKSKSKQAFSNNFAAEMKEGKPQPQALAVAYSVQRKNRKAKGGMIDKALTADTQETKRTDGEMHPADLMLEEERADSIADAIMRKRQMAEGGMVDIDEGNSEQPETYDERNEDAANEAMGDMSQVEDQPMDSNEHSISLDDEDEHDMVSKIRRSMKSRSA